MNTNLTNVFKSFIRGIRKAFVFIRERNAFSLIEIVVVIAFVGIVSVVAVTALFGTRSRTELDSATKQIAAFLREAQSRATNQDENTVWGVHFDNSTSTTPFYALFKTSYSAANTISRFSLPSTVQFATSSVAQGGTLDITFTQLSGVPSTSTSIRVRQTRGTVVVASSTIVVGASGPISF